MATGHIRQRSKKRKDSWTLVVDMGRGPDGKRKQLSRSIKGPKRNAEAELARLLHEINTNAFIVPSKITTGEHLDNYLDFKRPSLAYKTAQSYDSLTTHHLKPILGNIPLASLTTARIQIMISDLQNGGRKDNRPGGLSPKSIRSINGLLFPALEYAVTLGLIPRNPANGVTLPKYERPDIRVLTEQEIKLVLKALSGTEYHDLVLLGLASGARRGEALALTYSQINEGQASVAINRSVYQRKGDVGFKKPKTKSGNRIIHLPEIAMDMLQNRKQELISEIGPAAFNGDCFVFEHNGSVWSPDLFSRQFTKLIGKLGLPRFSFHDLRHTHATHLLNAGVNLRVVSYRLGHSSPAFTLEFYGHLLPNSDELAADAANVLLSGTL